MSKYQVRFTFPEKSGAKHMLEHSGYLGDIVELGTGDHTPREAELLCDIETVGAQRDEYAGRIKRAGEQVSRLATLVKLAINYPASSAIDVGMILKELEYILRTGHGKREGSK